MALPTGTITMNDVNIELGRSSGGQISLNDSDVRQLAQRPSGTISMNDLRGKSASVPFQIQEFIAPGYITSTSYTVTFSGPINDGDFLIVAGIRAVTSGRFTTSLPGFTYLFRHREWSFSSSHRYFSMVVFYRRCNGTEGSNYSVTLPFPSNYFTGQSNRRTVTGVRIQGAKNSAISSHYFRSPGGRDRNITTNVPATSASNGVKKEAIFGQVLGNGFRTRFRKPFGGSSVLSDGNPHTISNPSSSSQNQAYPYAAGRAVAGQPAPSSSGSFPIGYDSGTSQTNYYTSEFLRVTMGDNGN